MNISSVKLLLCCVIITCGALNTIAQKSPQIPELLSELNNSDHRGLEISLQVNPPKNKFQKGDQLLYQITTNKDCYFSLLSFQANGSWLVLFPNQFENDCSLNAENGRTIPSNNSYQLIVDEPYGAELVCAIASLSEAELALKIKELIHLQRENYIALSRGIFPVEKRTSNNTSINSDWDISWIRIQTSAAISNSKIPMLSKPYAFAIIITGLGLIIVGLLSQRQLRWKSR